MKKEFFRYLSMTPWKNFKQISGTQRKIRKIFNRLKKALMKIIVLVYITIIPTTYPLNSIKCSIQLHCLSPIITEANHYIRLLDTFKVTGDYSSAILWYLMMAAGPNI